MVQELIDAGKFDEAATLIQTQKNARKISGHGAHDLELVLARARGRAMPSVKKVAPKRAARKPSGHTVAAKGVKKQ